jgi:hypothetical protein
MEPNRDEQHGGMEAVGTISQSLRIVIRASRNWHLLTPGEQEALEMIAHKVARILCGNDPHDPEHWTDVAGYSHAAMRGYRHEQGQPEPVEPEKIDPPISSTVGRPLGLAHDVARLLANDFSNSRPGSDYTLLACRMLRVVGFWLSTRGNSGCANELYHEADQ